MNILILMDMPLFPYRIYAYNELSNRGYDLTVISVSDEDMIFLSSLSILDLKRKLLEVL